MHATRATVQWVDKVIQTIARPKRIYSTQTTWDNLNLPKKKKKGEGGGGIPMQELP